MIRAFIALEIPDEVLTKIISIRDESLAGIKNIKWEPKEKLHVTLKFLGDVTEESIEKYCEVLEKISVKYKCMELSFSHFGVFKRGDDPKILWVGLKKNKFLFQLAEDIEETFEKFGFEKEKRKFKSHITLLRFKGYEDSKKILSLTQLNISEINFSSDKITFFESRLLQSGSIYKPIKSFNLKN